MSHVRTESLYRVRLRKDAEIPDCTDFNASNNTFNRAMRRSEGELIERAKLLSDQLVQELHLWDLDGLLNSNTGGPTSPKHNREVQHSVDELNPGNLQKK